VHYNSRTRTTDEFIYREIGVAIFDQRQWYISSVHYNSRAGTTDGFIYREIGVAIFVSKVAPYG
jgi:hypothetical protein